MLPELGLRPASLPIDPEPEGPLELPLSCPLCDVEPCPTSLLDEGTLPPLEVEPDCQDELPGAPVPPTLEVSDGETGVELCPEVVLDPAIPVELERLSLELE